MQTNKIQSFGSIIVVTPLQNTYPAGAPKPPEPRRHAANATHALVPHTPEHFRTCPCARTHAWQHARTYVHTCTLMHLHTHAFMHGSTQACAAAHTHARQHFMHTLRHAYAHAFADTCLSAHGIGRDAYYLQHIRYILDINYNYYVNFDAGSLVTKLALVPATGLPTPVPIKQTFVWYTRLYGCLVTDAYYSCP